MPLDQETLWWIFALNDNIRVHAPKVWVEEIERKLERLREMYAAPTSSDTDRRSAVETGPQEADNAITRISRLGARRQ